MDWDLFFDSVPSSSATERNIASENSNEPQDDTVPSICEEEGPKGAPGMSTAMLATWTTESTQFPPMPTARFGCAVVKLGGQSGGSASKIVVMGGHDNDGNYLTTVECLDMSTKTWSSLPSMKTPRSGCAAVALGGSTASSPNRGSSMYAQQRPHIMVVGGFNDTHGCLNTAEGFSFATNEWTPMPGRMNQRRQGCAAVVVTGGNGLADHGRCDIFAIGGYSVGGARNQLDTIERYNLLTERWVTVPQPMSIGRAFCAAVVVGGHNGGGGGGGAPNMATSRANGQGQKLIVMGGHSNEYDVRCTNSVEMFDLSWNKWTPLPPMVEPRWSFGVALVGGDNSTVIAIGGGDGRKSSAEYLDYSAWSAANEAEKDDDKGAEDSMGWANLPSMATGRAGCVACATGVGQGTKTVLVLGGRDESDTALDSVETLCMTPWTPSPHRLQLPSLSGNTIPLPDLPKVMFIGPAISQQKRALEIWCTDVHALLSKVRDVTDREKAQVFESRQTEIHDLQAEKKLKMETLDEQIKRLQQQKGQLAADYDDSIRRVEEEATTAVEQMENSCREWMDDADGRLRASQQQMRFVGLSTISSSYRKAGVGPGTTAPYGAVTPTAPTKPASSSYYRPLEHAGPPRSPITVHSYNSGMWDPPGPLDNSRSRYLSSGSSVASSIPSIPSSLSNSSTSSFPPSTLEL